MLIMRSEAGRGLSSLIVRWRFLIAFAAVLAGCADGAGPVETLPPPPPVLPQRSGRIVFQANCSDGVDLDIFSVAADGSDRRQLTSGPGLYLQPAWSVDGSKIAFIAIPDDFGDFVAVMNPDGSGQHSVTTTHADRNPSWSPDGTRIAFESRRSGAPRLAIVNADGTGLREMVSGTDPNWSPDGRTIAYRTSGTTGWAIGLIGPDGQNDRRLTTPPGASDEYATWSPDGSRLAFARFWIDSPAGLFVVDADGRNERRVTTLLALTPSWSPDGRQIVFAHAETGNTTHLYIINADGTGLRQLTDGPCQELYPSW